jgi:hypothetical protein
MTSPRWISIPAHWWNKPLSDNIHLAADWIRQQVLG